MILSNYYIFSINKLFLLKPTGILIQAFSLPKTFSTNAFIALLILKIGNQNMLHMSDYRDQQRRLGPSLGPFNKLKTVWSETAKRLTK